MGRGTRKAGAPWTERLEAMKLALFLGSLFAMAGYFRVIPELSGVADFPTPLMAGGIITFCMIYALAKVEP